MNRKIYTAMFLDDMLSYTTYVRIEGFNNGRALETIRRPFREASKVYEDLKKITENFVDNGGIIIMSTASDRD